MINAIKLLISQYPLLTVAMAWVPKLVALTEQLHPVMQLITGGITFSVVVITFLIKLFDLLKQWREERVTTLERQLRTKELQDKLK
jgi:hypothetical protein